MAYKPKPGVILIPDISGYTEFLNEVELTHSAHIVTDLLEALLSATYLPLKLSEVEGDALLFYKRGRIPPYEELEGQARRWIEAFHTQLNLMRRDNFCDCGACNSMGRLSLKVVGHYGEIGIHSIGRLTKLIGRDVVLVHRLLKNTVSFDEYCFFSRSLWEAAGAPGLPEDGVVHCDEDYPIFGCVPMIARDLSAVRRNLAPTAPRPALRRLPRSVAASVLVDAEWAAVTALLGHAERQMEWMDDSRSVDMDPSEPPHAGQHHVCVLGHRHLHQTHQDHDLTDTYFRISYVIRPPRLILRALHSHTEASLEGNAVRVSIRFEYALHPAMGWAMARMGERRMRKMLERNLDKLKRVLEQPAAAEHSGADAGAPPEPATAMGVN